MLRLHPEVRDDLDAADRWCEAQEIGLGRQFLTEVRYPKSIFRPLE